MADEENPNKDAVAPEARTPESETADAMRQGLDELRGETTHMQTRMELADLQETVKTTLTPEEKEKLTETSNVKSLIEDYFGKDSAATKFLTNILSAIMDFAGMGGEIKPLTDQEVFGEIKTAEEKAKIEGGVIAHRGLGHGVKEENSIVAIEAAAKAGDEVEFDVRMVDGKLVLGHSAEDVKGLEFTSVFEVFKKHPKSRMVIDLKGGPELVDEIAKLITNPEDQKKTVFIAWTPDTVRAIYEKLPLATPIFHYLPTGGFPLIEKTLLAAMRSGNIGKETLEEILTRADAMSDTHNAAYFRNISLHIEGETPKDGVKNEKLFTYSVLPSSSGIMDILKARGGALAVPWPFVKNFPDLFQMAKAAGIKIAVSGFSTLSPEKQRGEMQQAIAMGANLVFSDYGPMIKA